ncbi:MAG TPA: hypothetical protein VIK78_10650 [Ruminiclostridium sp.]
MNNKYLSRVRKLSILANVIFYGMIVFTAAALAISIIAITYPSDKFIAVKGNNNWLFKFNFTSENLRESV